MTKWIAALAVTGALAGCSTDATVGVEDSGAGLDGGATDSSVPPIPGLMALRVEPGMQTLVEDGVVPFATATYRAVGTFEDGERDVTASVGWSIDDPRLGDVSAGVFTGHGIGGQARVVAAAGSLAAGADVIVVLEVSVVAPGLPGDVASMFPDDTSGDVADDANGPRILYPSHETMFPRNLAR